MEHPTCPRCHGPMTIYGRGNLFNETRIYYECADPSCSGHEVVRRRLEDVAVQEGLF